MGLAEARREALRISQLVKAGLDPRPQQQAAQHKEEKPELTVQDDTPAVPTFRKVAETVIVPSRPDVVQRETRKAVDRELDQSRLSQHRRQAG